MHWPQITYAVLLVLNLGFILAKHGESSGKHNFWMSLFCTGIVVWLLYKGGFWSGV